MKKQRSFLIEQINLQTNKKEEIKLSEDILLLLYARYKNINLRNNYHFRNIKKVMLPNNEAKALTLLNNGILIEDERYIPLLTTAGMMKKEDSDLNSKCEYLFIHENDAGFVKLYENLISLNKIDKLRNTEICINKDVVSRLGLALSSSFKIDYVPRVIILPTDTYTYTSNYVTFNEKLNLVELNNYSKDHTFADGCGFASEKMCEIIQEQLNTNYRVDFFGLRIYNGTATKGLCVRANWNSFFDEFYEKDSTGIFEKRNDGYYTKDFFGNMVNISTADLILNENMCKWSKLWEDENFKDINEAIKEELNKGYYENYRDLLECLYVTKINKKNVADYTLTSYQLINNLALTPKELATLSKNTEELYRRINAGEVDATRLYLNDIAREELEEYELSASTKVHKLLQLNDEKYIKTGIVKSTVNKLIKKSAMQSAGGKFYVKGNYKTACIDPICYLKWIMTRDISKSAELKKGEFFVPGEYGKRVINRNPQAVFSEAHRVNLVENSLLQKYFGNLTNELIFFNQVDDTAMTSSGQDFDCDFNGVWDNEIIYNAVIEPQNGRHYINLDDGNKATAIYSEENTYKAILSASGNLIGSIANMTTKLSNLAQDLGYRFKDEINSYKELKDYFLLAEEKQEDSEVIKWVNKRERAEGQVKIWTEEFEMLRDSDTKETLRIWKEEVEVCKSNINNLFKKALAEKVESKRFIEVTSLAEEEIRKIIINQFYDLKYYSYYALYQSQRAIDAPKTNLFPTKEDLKILKDFIKEKRIRKYPLFMFYSNWSSNKDNAKYINFADCNFTNSALNINATRIQQELIKPINLFIRANDNNTVLINLLKEKSLENKECSEEVKKIWEEYKLRRNEVTSKFKGQDSLLNQKLNEIDFNAAMAIKNLSWYAAEEIAFALTSNNCSTRFIVNFAWETVESIIRKEERTIKIYKEDVEGNISWKFKKYRKVDATLKDDNIQEKYINDLRKKVSYNYRVGGYIGAEITENVVVSYQEYVDKKTGEIKEQPLLFNANQEQIGWVWLNRDTKVNLLDFKGEILAVDTYKINKAGNGLDIGLLIF